MTPLLTRGGRPQDYEVDKIFSLSSNPDLGLRCMGVENNEKGDGNDRTLYGDENYFRTVLSLKRKFLWNIRIQAMIVITKWN